MSSHQSQNARTHGLRSSEVGDKAIENLARAQRKAFRDSVLTLHGEVTPYHEAVLQSAIRHETRARLAAKWLRKEGDGLSLAERLSLTAAISQATDARDKCLKLVGLDRSLKTLDPWDTLDESASPTDGRLATGSHLASPLTHSQANPPVESDGSQIVDSGASGEAERGIPAAGVAATDTQAEFTAEDRTH